MAHKKKTDPAVSEYYRKLQAKSWAVREKKIIEAAKLDKTPIPTSKGE